MRILLVEDEPDTLFALKLLLEFDGHQVITAQNGSEGYRKYIGQYPDLVITDINMPEIDGIELSNIIRTDHACPKTPIIVITAHGAKVGERAMAAGADIYLNKPYDYDQLKQVIERVTADDYYGMLAEAI